MNLATYISLERGNATQLAKGLGVGASYISQLASGHRCASAGTSSKIEKLTNNQVTRRDLRPHDWQDIWPDLTEKTEKETA
ncbi:MAG: helix-turn-helix domain-containing protein [Burkholderiaceae bacterium]|nr:helix-turn-helix domain-containing protein [Burkholderiaceae bacterium]